MTEERWLSCADPEAMLAHLKGRATDRKFRLLLVAFWRRRFGNLRTFKAYRKKLEQAEEMADGNWWPKRGQTGWIGHRKNPHYQAVGSVKILAGLRGKGHVSVEIQAVLIRDIFGNPFHPVVLDPAARQWNGGCAVALATELYESGDFSRAPLLADMLEDAGVSDAQLLDHLRGPGPHTRGCFAVDLVLGRE
jgi:hypothetical protein